MKKLYVLLIAILIIGSANAQEPHNRLMVDSLFPGNAGAITGLTTVCKGQNAVIYAVPPITNATLYIWTLPNGIVDSTLTDSLTINYASNATSGTISVKGHNSSGNGSSSSLAITVLSIPAAAGIITGNANVNPCQSFVYSVLLIPDATSYIWNLPNGSTGHSDSNAIVVKYNSGVIGNVIVRGHNMCGDGASSTFIINNVTYPVHDAGVIAILKPDSVACIGNNATVKIIIKNFGTSPITSVPVYYQIDSLTAVMETWSGSSLISFGDTTAYVFNTTLAAPAGNFINICAWTLLPNDECNANDKVCKTTLLSNVPSIPGTISGLTNVYAGQNNVVYSVPLNTVFYSYIWTLPGGVFGNSTSNSIITFYSSSAVSGNITVKGSNYCGIGPASTLAVTVNPTPPCSAQFIVVPDTSILHHYFIVNNATGTAPIHYHWSWGDGTYDSIPYPSHTYSAAAWYKICLTILDSFNCTNTYCDSTYLQKSTNNIISVSVIPQGTLGINTNEAHQVKIYPNPVKDILTIETNSNTKQNIEITNLLGQTLYTSYIYNKVTINVSAFPKGIYILKLNTDKGTVVKKFVKE